MLTVVVQEGETPQDWSLVERFFNSGISSGTLSFFRHQESSKSDYTEVVHKVLEYLHLKMVDEWQLIWMMSISQEKDFRERLSSQLARFQIRFLDKLQVRRIQPVKVFIVAFDCLARNEDGTPVDPFLKQVWELEVQGYLPDKPSLEGNLFYEAEIVTIDQDWSPSLDLREAGPLEAPKLEFMHLLESRVSQLKRSFRDKILAPKRRLLDKVMSENPSHIPTDMLSDGDLNAIESAFYDRLNQLSIAPLSPKLAQYKPSVDLKEVVKGLLGIKASIKPYIFIRAPYSQNSSTRRVNSLLKAAYTINAIAMNSSSSRHWLEGNAYVVDVTFQEAELQTLLSRYITRLYIGKSKVEHSLHNRRDELTPDFGEWAALPYGQSVLKELDIPRLQFTYKERFLFEQDFRAYGETVRDIVKNRDHRIVVMSKEGMRKLDTVKKVKEEPLLSRKLGAEEALFSIREEAERIREQLVPQLPHKAQALTEWDSCDRPLKDEITYHLRSIPQARQIGWLISIVILIMMSPYLVRGDEGSSASGYPSLLSNSVYPVMVVTALLVCMVLSMTLIVKKIKKRVHHSEQRLEELTNEQLETQQHYSDYLNKLYKLHKLSGRASHIQKFRQQKHKEALLLRYHHTELQNAIEVSERLAYLLNIQIRNVTDSAETGFDDQAWFEQNRFDHPVYSPFGAQYDVDLLGVVRTQLVFGLSRDTVRDSRLYPASRISVEQDKVYRL